MLAVVCLAGDSPVPRMTCRSFAASPPHPFTAAPHAGVGVVKGKESKIALASQDPAAMTVRSPHKGRIASWLGARAKDLCSPLTAPTPALDIMRSAGEVPWGAICCWPGNRPDWL